MGILRGIIYGLPALLALVLAASFASVKLTPAPRKNELITAGIGEAKILNPIQSTTGADGEIQSQVFGSLLRYSENLEIEGDHAKSWDLAQTTTFYFFSRQEALAAKNLIDADAAHHPEWKLADAAVEEDRLTLRFTMPGTKAPREIEEIFRKIPPPPGTSAVSGKRPPAALQPLSVIRVTLKAAARDAVHHFLKTSACAAQVRRFWVDSSTAYELSVTGQSAEILKELRLHHEANASLGASAEVIDTLSRLDEPEITFHLRDDIRWHDGEPFTARDVEFTFRMIMDETVASPRRPDYELVAKIETPDAHTVRVMYRRPYSPALTSWMIGLLPAHVLEGKASAWWAEHFNRAPVGTGPFRFKEWKTNEHIALERNPDYFAGRSHLDTIVVRVIPDPVAIRLAFETGQVDFWGVSQHAVGTFEKDPRFSIFASPSPAYEYIGWNLRRPLFQDVKVRRALAHAVDVDSIIRFVLYGHGEISNGIFPPQMWFADASVRPYEFNPDKAKALLAEAGWVPGADGVLSKNGRRFSFDLITNMANDVRKDIATLVQADLKKIGIDVRVQIYEWTVFISEHINTCDFDAAALGWSLGYDYDQYQIWHSTQTAPGRLNFVGYENPEADRLLEDIRTCYDTAEIAGTAGRLQRIIYEDQPYLFLYVPKSVGAMWKDAYRVSRPAATGDRREWIDEPVRMTKAGFRYYQDWFYRPQYPPVLAP